MADKKRDRCESPAGGSGSASARTKPEFSESFSRALEIPLDVALDLPKLIFTGNRELYVENYKGIVEYSEKHMRLRAAGFVIKINGTRLLIKEIGKDFIVIMGRIEGLGFTD